MPVPSLWRATLVAAIMAQQAIAGYMSVSVTPTIQCGNATVTWTGDEGPWHLLLTPTDFTQYSYNLWVPEIPINATNWTIPINQPYGLNFMITMWGASGIRYAGTTDVLTVGRPNNTNATCFLSDEAILSLYTFSFNISDTSGYPPECSNLSMTWPSSLDSFMSPRSLDNSVDLSQDNSVDLYPRDNSVDLYPRQSAPVADNPSSSDRKSGNTTKPPTMFGIIPLGNSFSIPITFSTNYTGLLPDSVISDDPTTWTRQGVTHLNWTVGLSKGTRFILVAGMGDEKQWASGGSSQMLTVGQGSLSCYGYNQPGGLTTDLPSITGSSTATTTLSPPFDEASTGSSSSKLSVVGTTIVSVASVLVTLLLVGICFCCYRIRRRRRQAAQLSAYGDLKPQNTKRSTEEIPLDIITPSRPPPIDTSTAGLARPLPYDSPIHPHIRALDTPTGTISTMSPIERQGMRQSSADPLLSNPSSPINTHTSRSNPSDGVTDLKLETLAQFDRDAPGPSRRRDDDEMEYMVHRDAGRVRELPPRYEELNWEEEARREAERR